MKYPYKIADELIPVLKQYRNQPSPPEGTSLQDTFRMALKEMAKQVSVKSTDELKVENKTFKNSEGIDIKLRVFTPNANTETLPCLYWMHGGGTMSGLPEQEDSTLFDMALEVGCVIVSVDYRLAPENPYPAPINDCYEGLVYVANNANDFNIDNERIAVLLNEGYRVHLEPLYSNNHSLLAT